MRLTISLLTATLLAAAGCGNNPLPSPDMGNNDLSVPLDLLSTPDMQNAPVSFTQYVTDFANAICARKVECGQLPNDATSMANCFQKYFRPSGADIDTEIAKGRLQVNDAQCVSAQRNRRCDGSDSGFLGSRCSTFLYTPLQALGSACIIDQECIGGYCAHAGSDAGAPGASQPFGCPGVCTAYKTAGQSCLLSVECNAAIANCTNQVCVPYSAAGQPCDPLNGPSCQAGLFCPTWGTSRTCQQPGKMGALGDACDPAQGNETPVPACAAGLYCQLQYPDGGGAGSSIGGICRAKLASGSPCNPLDVSQIQFEDNPCADGTACYTTGAAGTETCQLFGTNGASCLAAPFNSCVDTYNCNNKTCQSVLAIGAPCPTIGINPQCASSVCGMATADLGTAGMCVPRRGFGASCDPATENTICAPAQFVEYCAPSGNGGGVCAPKCF